MRGVSGRETARTGQTWGQQEQKETQSTGGWDAQKTKRLPGENPGASSGKTNTWPMNYLKTRNQNKAWLLLIVLQMWNKTLHVITLLYGRPLVWVSVLGKFGSLKDGEQSLLSFSRVSLEKTFHLPPSRFSPPELELQACTTILSFIKLLTKKDLNTLICFLHPVPLQFLCVWQRPPREACAQTHSFLDVFTSTFTQASLREEGWEFPLPATTKTPTLPTFNAPASFFSLLAVPLKMITLPWFFQTSLWMESCGKH